MTTGRADRRIPLGSAGAKSLVATGLLVMAGCLTTGCSGPNESGPSHGVVPAAQVGPLVEVTRCAQTGPHTVALTVDLINPLPTPAQFSGHVAVTNGQGSPFATAGLGHIGPIGPGSRQHHTETLVREHNDATDARCEPRINKPQDWSVKLREMDGHTGQILGPENVRLNSCDGPTAVDFRNPQGPTWNVWAWVERFDIDGASLGAGIAQIWPGLTGEPLWGRQSRAVPIDKPRANRPIAGGRGLGAWSVHHEDVPPPPA